MTAPDQNDSERSTVWDELALALLDPDYTPAEPTTPHLDPADPPDARD